MCCSINKYLSSLVLKNCILVIFDHRSKFGNEVPRVDATTPEQPYEFTYRSASTAQDSSTKEKLNGAGYYEGLNSGRNPQRTYDELNSTHTYETPDAVVSQKTAIHLELHDSQKYDKLNAGTKMDENTCDGLNVEGQYDRSLGVRESNGKSTDDQWNVKQQYETFGGVVVSGEKVDYAELNKSTQYELLNKQVQNSDAYQPLAQNN